MPKVSPERLEATRRRVLDGARRAFASYGYEGATVRRLEEETGLSADDPVRFGAAKLVDAVLAASAR